MKRLLILLFTITPLVTMADYIIPFSRLNLTNEFQHDLAQPILIGEHKVDAQNSLVHLKMGNGISNGFFIVDEHLDFDKTIRSGKCHGTVPYPKLTNEDEELFMRINNEIHDFVELYSICNSGERNHFSVNYDVPNSGTKDFFSILWLTKKDDKLWRIDVLNFNAETGAMLTADNVFNIHSNHLFSELVKLSEGHLNSNCSWEQFLEKIEKRDIQFYIKSDEWYLVFNSSEALNKVVEIKIPQYFLIQRDDHDNE